MIFENFIIKCCAMDEWDLRSFLKDKLKAAGFEIHEDDYRSHRQGKYQKVHNMLAIRGSNPKVCLVAHTDVVRDHHSAFRGKFVVNPVIKNVKNRFGNEIRIIQDKDCKTQVGGDDRLGVAINTWIALNTGYDMGLLFTTDEESGNQSAEYSDFPEFEKFELFVQVDRGNLNRQLVVNIGGCRLCDVPTAQRLLKIAQDIQLPREPVMGLMTDVLALKSAGKIKNAVNMTCGYHNNHSQSEYIDIQESQNTLKYVNEIIKYYDLENIDSDSNTDIDMEEDVEREAQITYYREMRSVWN